MIICSHDQQWCRLQVVRKCPDIDWEKVWKYLYSSVLSAYLTSSWYVAIHDIVPTNDRLAAIHLTPTSACSNCGQEVSIQHRITDCGEGPILRNWTRMKMGIILRMDPKYIHKEWTIRPVFTFWPKKRHAVILWILAHLVHYRLQTNRRLSLYDFMDFLRRSRWELRPHAGKLPPTGRYLEVLGWSGPVGALLGNNDTPRGISTPISST